MVEITMDLISYLEKLGRIRLTDEEKEKAIIDLGSILGYIDKLNELDTDSVEPLSHAFLVTNVYREDIVTNTNCRDSILSNAPRKKEASSKYPKPLKKRLLPVLLMCLTTCALQKDERSPLWKRNR